MKSTTLILIVTLLILGACKPKDKSIVTEKIDEQTQADSAIDIINEAGIKIEFIKNKVDLIDITEDLKLENYEYENDYNEIFEIWIAKDTHGAIVYLIMPVSDSPDIQAMYYFDKEELIFISIVEVEKGYVADETEYHYYIDKGNPFYFERFIIQDIDILKDTSYVLNEFTDDIDFPLYYNTKDVDEVIKKSTIID